LYDYVRNLNYDIQCVNHSWFKILASTYLAIALIEFNVGFVLGEG